MSSRITHLSLIESLYIQHDNITIVQHKNREKLLQILADWIRPDREAYLIITI